MLATNLNLVLFPLQYSKFNVPLVPPDAWSTGQFWSISDCVVKLVVHLSPGATQRTPAHHAQVLATEAADLGSYH